MNTQSNFEPHFPYHPDQVRLECLHDEGLYVVYIYITDRPVNRKFFFSNQEATNHIYNLELAMNLGATFNDQGYWNFEFPPHEKKRRHDEYYRLSKG